MEGLNSSQRHALEHKTGVKIGRKWLKIGRKLLKTHPAVVGLLLEKEPRDKIGIIWALENQF